MIGSLLHPNIPYASFSHPLKIADVATGTGIWAADLARQLPPTAHVDGFDISDAQFPPSAQRPGNLSLHGGFDVFKPVPQEFRGIYDVVHIRLLILVIDKDPTEVVKNLVAMLKPGGYLQWSDIDMANCTVRGPPESPKAGLNAILQSRFKGGRDHDAAYSYFQSAFHLLVSFYQVPVNSNSLCRWVHQLMDYYEKYSLKNCQYHAYGEPVAPFTTYFSQSRIFTAQEISRRTLRTPEEIEESSKQCLEAVEELRQGSYFYIPLVVVIGQKPDA